MTKPLEKVVLKKRKNDMYEVVEIYNRKVPKIGALIDEDDLQELYDYDSAYRNLRVKII